MAVANLGTLNDVVDKRQLQGAGTSPIATPANYEDVSAMRSRLGTINGSYFTAAMLNTMTKNDMVYALRLADDSAGV